MNRRSPRSPAAGVVGIAWKIDVVSTLRVVSRTLDVVVGSVVARASSGARSGCAEAAGYEGLPSNARQVRSGRSCAKRSIGLGS
jgi:hypothetical protein